MLLFILGILLKLTGVVLLLSWLLFTQWSLRKAKGFKEILSMQRWFFVVTFLGIFGILTQFWMFFPAWYFRNKKKRYFSWWLDDSRYDKNRPSGLKEDFEIYLNGRKETFWVSYLWHLRNMIWNKQNKYRVKPQTIPINDLGKPIGNQNIVIKHLIKDTIKKYDGTKLIVDGIYGQFAGLKYWKNGKSTWNTMNGEQISKEKSILGTGFYFYLNEDQPIEDNQLNWTFTSCKLVKYWFFWKRWRTIQLGMKQKGYSRQLKYQKNIEWK